MSSLPLVILKYFLINSSTHFCLIASHMSINIPSLNNFRLFLFLFHWGRQKNYILHFLYEGFYFPKWFWDFRSLFISMIFLHPIDFQKWDDCPDWLWYILKFHFSSKLSLIYLVQFCFDQINLFFKLTISFGLSWLSINLWKHLIKISVGSILWEIIRSRLWINKIYISFFILGFT
jgi:hypothetical protein